MTTERPTADIAAELRAVAKSGGFLAELLTEAADKLDVLLACLLEAKEARDEALVELAEAQRQFTNHGSE